MFCFLFWIWIVEGSEMIVYLSGLEFHLIRVQGIMNLCKSTSVRLALLVSCRVVVCSSVQLASLFSCGTVEVL